MDSKEIKQLIEEAKNQNPTLMEVHGLMDLAYNDGLKEKEEYAKQVAIDFANYTQVNYWEHDDDQLWYKWLLRKETDINLTSEQLFELYLQSKQ